MKPVIVIGGGGHAKVVAATLFELGARVLGFTDPDSSRTVLAGLARMGGDDAILRHPPADILLAHGLGSIGPSDLRARVFQKFKDLGYSFITLVHPSATVAADVEIGEGTVIFAGSVVQPGTRIGSNAILNTRCSVDHDCVIGPHVHIAPGATLSGGVLAASGCHIGIGASVIQGIAIGADSLVGAGSVVLRDVAAGSRVFGVPARVIPS
jgi:sugar O-acyltransferase (sialic acid O-acetyltransferase NeuD family)